MDIPGTNPSKVKIILGLGIALLGAVLLPSWLYAHGTNIQMSAAGRTLSVQAFYDTGEPMSNAQVIVYAADNPREAWMTGEADAEGRFSFDVDTSISGEWAISLRTAGHGELIHFDVTRRGVIELTAGDGRTPLQTALMAGGVLVVLGGVAFYFSRPRKEKAAPAVG